MLGFAFGPGKVGMVIGLPGLEGVLSGIPGLPSVGIGVPWLGPGVFGANMPCPLDPPPGLPVIGVLGLDNDLTCNFDASTLSLRRSFSAHSFFSSSSLSCFFEVGIRLCYCPSLFEIVV